MLRFSFRKGIRFLKGSLVWTLIRRLTDGTLQLEGEDGRLWVLSESELLVSLGKEGVSVHAEDVRQGQYQVQLVSRDLASYSPELQESAKRKIQYVEAYLNEEPKRFSREVAESVIQRVAVTISDSTPPSSITLYRWLQRYRWGKSITNLVDRFHHRGKGRRWVDRLEQLVQEVVDAFFLKKERHSKKEVIDQINRRINIHNDTLGNVPIQTPSKATLYRYLSLFEAYEVVEKRYGKKTARAQFRSVRGIQCATRLFERWEIDHTPINLLVFCSTTGLPIGRPWLTAAMDKRSRMIVGFYLTFSPPSAESVLQAIRHSILPKEDWLKPWPDIESDWPVSGIPEMIVCDNGMDLHALAIQHGCLELGIKLQFCPAKKPEYKGAIERFMRTINHDLIHSLPGTVFSSPQERGEYDSMEEACIDLNTLTHLITKWIVEVYHHSPHRGIGTTPYKKWQAEFDCVIPEHPTDSAQLEVILGHTVERSVFHYGVEINSLYYNSSHLQDWLRRYGHGQKVRCKYHVFDLGYIHFFDNDLNGYVEVPAIDQQYADGLRLVQHELIRKQVRLEGNNPNEQRHLLAKKAELQEIIADALRSKKMLRRKKARVLLGTLPADLSSQNGSTSAKPVVQTNSILSNAGETERFSPELPALVVRHRSARTRQEVL